MLHHRRLNVPSALLVFVRSFVLALAACGTAPPSVTIPAQSAEVTTTHHTHGAEHAAPTAPSTQLGSDTDCFTHEHSATRYRDVQSDLGEATSVEDALVTRRTNDALGFALVIRIGDGVHCLFQGTALPTTSTQYLYVDNAESGGACRLKLDVGETGVLVSEVDVAEDQLSACVEHHCNADGPVTSGLPRVFTRKPCMESITELLPAVR